MVYNGIMAGSELVGMIAFIAIVAAGSIIVVLGTLLKRRYGKNQSQRRCKEARRVVYQTSQNHFKKHD